MDTTLHSRCALVNAGCRRIYTDEPSVVVLFLYSVVISVIRGNYNAGSPVLSPAAGFSVRCQQGLSVTQRDGTIMRSLIHRSGINKRVQR